MRIRKLVILCCAALLLTLPASALGKYGMLPIYGQDVADGTYGITVESASERFQVTAATLTALDGTLTAELTVSGTDCIGLYLGTAEEAAAASEGWITTTETAWGGTVCSMPVAALDKALDCAWYSLEDDAWKDNKVLFDASSLPREALAFVLPDYDLIESALEGTASQRALTPVEPVSVALEDGEYAVSLSMTGGSGKAMISSPALMTVRGGKAYVQLLWSSEYYDYMIVGTETYYSASPEGANSVFEIPIACWDQEMTVIADTTAMGTPHEVQYTLTFYQNSIAGKGTIPQEAAKRVVAVAAAIILIGGVLNHVVKKKRRV